MRAEFYIRIAKAIPELFNLKGIGVRNSKSAAYISRKYNIKVFETNATFRSNELRPVMAGNIPDDIYALISRIVGEQLLVVEAATERDIEKAFKAFIADSLINLPLDKARVLFDEMIENTKHYLNDYNL